MQTNFNENYINRFARKFAFRRYDSQLHILISFATVQLLHQFNYVLVQLIQIPQQSTAVAH